MTSKPNDSAPEPTKDQKEPTPNKPEEKKKRRRIHNEPLDITQVERLAAAGLSDTQLRLALGVSRRQMTAWKHRADYQEAFKRGQNQANAIVERTLFQRATGYVYEEIFYESIPEEPSAGGKKAVWGDDPKQIMIKRVVKTAIPDTMAIMFYLNNKMPETYKNRNDSVVTSTQVIKVAELEGVTAGSVKRAKEAIQAKLAAMKGHALVTIRKEQQG